ncbi:MAG: TolC family protein [Saprospirales bacterium]|nr:TolC family protein [Saprospirales bacterium]MBK8921160.1 TolC family protein [Saprospirales bacterium]
MQTKLPVLSLAFFLSLGCAASHAQSSPVLEEYIRTGMNNNLALQQQQLDVQQSLEAVRQARSLFYPAVQFNATYTRAAGGRNIEIPLGDLMNPVYQTLNQILQSNQFPTIENASEQFLPDNFQETYLKISYPLFNSDLKYNRQIKEQLAQGKAAQKAAYEHELRYQITEAYLQYLQTLEAEKIWQYSREVLLELRRFNESLLKNNVATRDVVATADYELSKADHEIFQLQRNQNTARAYFNFLINRDLQAGVIADTTLLRQGVRAYDREEMIREALSDRHELAALRSGQGAADLALKMQESNRYLPDAYIGGQIGFQGFGYSFSSDQPYVLAQAGLTYDLFTGGQTRSKIQQARLETEKMRTQYQEAQHHVALQVTQAWNNLESARHGWATARNGLNAAEESFRIIGNKYRASQALLLEYLDAQNRVTTARLQVLLAWSDVLLREAALKKAAGL